MLLLDLCAVLPGTGPQRRATGASSPLGTLSGGRASATTSARPPCSAGALSQYAAPRDACAPAVALPPDGCAGMLWGAPLQDGCSSKCRAAHAGCPAHGSPQGGVLLRGSRASTSAVKLQLTCSGAPALRCLARKSPSPGVLQLASGRSAAGDRLKGSSSGSPFGALLEDRCEGQSGSGCDAGACELLPGSITVRRGRTWGRRAPRSESVGRTGTSGLGWWVKFALVWHADWLGNSGTCSWWSCSRRALTSRSCACGPPSALASLQESVLHCLWCVTKRRLRVYKIMHRDLLYATGCCTKRTAIPILLCLGRRLIQSVRIGAGTYGVEQDRCDHTGTQYACLKWGSQQRRQCCAPQAPVHAVSSLRGNHVHQ